MAQAAGAHDRGPIAESILLYPVVLLVMAYRSGLPWAPTGEPLRYFEFAGRVLGGELPFRDLSVEYPPLAVVPWMLPRLLSGSDAHAYAWLLAVQNAALAMGIGLCLTWLARHGWAASGTATVLATGLLLLVGVAPVVVWLFDLLPVLLVCLALIAVARDRPAIAGSMIALGALVKVFPAVLVPVVVTWYLVRGQRRDALRHGLAFAGVALAVMLPTILVAGPDALRFLEYQGARGIQLESLPAGIAMLIDLLGGPQVEVAHAFGSWQVGGPTADLLASVHPMALVAGLGAVLVVFARRCREDIRAMGTIPAARLVAFGLSAMLVVMVANKVLSPQFLVWLLPFGALLPRPQAALAVVASLVTVVLLGDNYMGMIELHPAMIVLLDVRNLLLVLLLAWLLVTNRPTSSVVLTAR